MPDDRMTPPPVGEQRALSDADAIAQRIAEDEAAADAARRRLRSDPLQPVARGGAGDLIVEDDEQSGAFGVRPSPGASGPRPASLPRQACSSSRTDVSSSRARRPLRPWWTLSTSSRSRSSATVRCSCHSIMDWVCRSRSIGRASFGSSFPTDWQPLEVAWGRRWSGRLRRPLRRSEAQDPSKVICAACRLGTVPHVEFSEDVRDVRLDGPRR
jgi:hypothetical protein